MNFKTIISVGFLSIGMATASLAAPVDFEFSFSDGVNTITGVIEGLDSNGSDQRASGVTVNGVTGTYTFGSATFASNTSLLRNSFNSFNVIDSVIQGAFLDTGFSGGLSDSGRNFETQLILASSSSFYEDDESENTGTPPPFISLTTRGNVTFNAIPLAAVPLPAGGLLLLSGVGCAAVFKRRKRIDG